MSAMIAKGVPFIEYLSVRGLRLIKSTPYLEAFIYSLLYIVARFNHAWSNFDLYAFLKAWTNYDSISLESYALRATLRADFRLHAYAQARHRPAG